MQLTHLGLFAGAGGFELAADMADIQTLAYVEWDEECRRVLKYWFPDADAHGDIDHVDFTKYANRVDVLTGGFPCQPYSVSGERRGTDDPRHKWPQMLRCIREVQPAWVVGENVRGLLNWSGGLVFEQVCADLETEGYEVLPLLLPACAVNAPHERYRVWFVAYSREFRSRREGLRQVRGADEGPTQRDQNAQLGDSGDGHDTHATEQGRKGRDGQGKKSEKSQRSRGKKVAADAEPLGDGEDRTEYKSGQSHKEGDKQRNTPNAKDNGASPAVRSRRRQPGPENVDRQTGGGDATNAQGKRVERRGRHRQQEPHASRRKAVSRCNYSGTRWRNFPTQSPVCGRNDGFPGRLARITVSTKVGTGTRILNASQSYGRWRKVALQMMGNAVVPELVLQIMKSIVQYEKSA